MNFELEYLTKQEISPTKNPSPPAHPPPNGTLFPIWGRCSAKRAEGAEGVVRAALVITGFLITMLCWAAFVAPDLLTKKDAAAKTMKRFYTQNKFRP